MARPKQKPTTKSKANVKTAKTLESTDKVGHKCRPKESTPEKIDANSAEANHKVIEALYTMAISGKNTTAAIFWAKTRCGMGEKTSEQKQQPSQAPIIIIRTEEGKKEESR